MLGAYFTRDDDDKLVTAGSFNVCKELASQFHQSKCSPLLMPNKAPVMIVTVEPGINDADCAYFVVFNRNDHDELVVVG